jgi:hypothetical protein
MYEILLLAATCVIVVPTDQVGNNASPRVVELHERTHCKGWTHSHDGPIVPPLDWQRKPFPRGMHIEVMRVPTTVATGICRAYGGDSYACQWFE